MEGKLAEVTVDSSTSHRSGDEGSQDAPEHIRPYDLALERMRGSRALRINWAPTVNVAGRHRFTNDILLRGRQLRCKRTLIVDHVKIGTIA